MELSGKVCETFWLKTADFLEIHKFYLVSFLCLWSVQLHSYFDFSYIIFQKFQVKSQPFVPATQLNVTVFCNFYGVKLA